MRHSPFTAVYDACVLYPAPLRDFLMRLPDAFVTKQATDKTSRSSPV